MSDNPSDSVKKSRTRIGPKKKARLEAEASGQTRERRKPTDGGRGSDSGKDSASSKNKKGNQTGLPSRKLALEILIKIEKDGAYANLALSAGFDRHTLSEQDRAFVTALVQGVLRNQTEIDSNLQKVSKEPLPKMPSLLRNLLRLSIFQLDYLSETPQHAVLDTSNRLARDLGHEGMVRYTNGVLRGYLRIKEKLAAHSSDTAESGTSKDVKALSIKYSLPEWLIEKWNEFYGVEETAKLLAWSKTEPGLTIRVSEVNVEPQTMLDIMNKNGFAARSGHLVPACLVFEGKEGKKSFRGSPAKLPGFDDGFFVVQDEAAAFVSLVLAARAGETIVDLCAAPGGKTIHIAEMLENTGRVIAVDKHESRLKLVKEARTKQGLKNLETVAADGREFQLGRLADRVLVDAPCSGTGVINRRTDIRVNRERSDIEKLTEVQIALLNNAASLVKPGGVLVYSTCSLEPEENIQVVEKFLKQNPLFKTSSLLPFINASVKEQWFDAESESSLPYVCTKAAAESGYLQLIPTKHGVAGFFICRMVREE